MRRTLTRLTAPTLFIVLFACNGAPDSTEIGGATQGLPQLPGVDAGTERPETEMPDAGGVTDAGPGSASPADAGGGTASGGSGGETPTGGGTHPASGIFPPDSPWNTRIDSAAVDPRSDAYVASMGADDPLVASWDREGDGLPAIEVPGDQPKVPVHFWGFPGESDPGPYPIPWNAPIDRSSDHHVMVVDRANGWLYELFGASRNADGSWSAANGAKWNLRTNDQRPLRWTSADAAGMPIYPGVVRWDEVESGWIGHALRFAVNRSQRGFVAPARHAAGQCPTWSDCPPMGLRVRLKSSVDISGFSPRVQVVLRALQQYGMFVADNSGDTSWWVAGAPDTRWSDSETLSFQRLRGRDFEVVEHGDIQPQ